MEGSSRILIDRAVIRLDGRPYFSFGPRVMLTAPELYPQTLREIAEAGFTCVGSPPCSPGTLMQVNAFFKAAEAAGLLVVLIADPRLPEHGSFLADHFRQRPSLHSYLLPPRASDQKSLETYLRDRDAIRARDLFHPIWMPLSPANTDTPWLRAQDIYAPHCDVHEPVPTRIGRQRAGERMEEFAAATRAVSPRPLFCADLRVGASDQERLAGIYDEDPLVARVPPRVLDLFPWMAGFGQEPRRDFLGPDPEYIRLQVYRLLGEGTRGILLHFFEAFRGCGAFSGADRYAECSLLAREISLFSDFFAEGRSENVELETGHPRLAGTATRHGREILVTLRMAGFEEEFFIDEATMERSEISLRVENPGEIKAWRMDFPVPRALEVVRGTENRIRILAGTVELTGAIFLAPGTQRAEQIIARMADLLPAAARSAVEMLEGRVQKIMLVERELQGVNCGVDNQARIAAIQRGLDEARALLAAQSFADAYTRARQTVRFTRQLIKYQMARALASAAYESSSRRLLLRASYYTLPTYYREGIRESARAFTDLT